MNNIQKNFKRKSQLRAMADGGPVSGAPLLGTGTARGAARQLNGRGRQIDAAVDSTTAVGGGAPMVAPTGDTRLSNIRDGAVPPAHMLRLRGMANGGLFGGAKTRQQQLDEQEARAMGLAPKPQPQPQPQPVEEPKKKKSWFGFADGGSLRRGNAAEIEEGHGGEVEGPGGPTDDDVGPVALSADEYVLPADTVDKIGKETLDELVEETHTPVKPKGKGLRGMANGTPGYDVSFHRDVDTAIRRPPVKYPSASGIAVEEIPMSQAAEQIGKPTKYPGVKPGAYTVSEALPAAQEHIEIKAPRGTNVFPDAPPGASGSAARAAENMGTRPGGQFGYSGPGKPIPKPTMAGRVARAGLRGARAAGGFLAPAAVLGGGVMTAMEDEQQRSDFADSVNADLGTIGGSLKATLLRTANNIGNAATFGQAEKFGKGLSAHFNGGKFSDGWSEDAGSPAPEKRAGTGAPPAAIPGQDPGVTSALRNMGVTDQEQAAPGVPYADAQAASQFAATEGGQHPNIKLNTQGNADIFAGSNLRSGKLNSFSGVGDPNRLPWEQRPENRADHEAALGRAAADKAALAKIEGTDADSRFNQMADEIRGAYGGGTYGRIGAAKRLTQLSALREGAIANQNNTAAQRAGYDNQAETARNRLRFDAGKFQQERADKADTAGAEAEEKGYERYTGAVKDLFKTTDPATGKEMVDVAKQESFRNYLESTDPRGETSFAAMKPADQMKIMQDFLKTYSMTEARNAAADSGFWNKGGVTNKFAMPKQLRESQLSDVFGSGHLSGVDYLRTKLMPGVNSQVVIDETGQATPYEDMVGNDLDKQQLINELIQKRGLRRQ